MIYNFDINFIYNDLFTQNEYEYCTFNNCDLIMTYLNNTIFRETKFIDCKMLGLWFETCNLFLLSFIFINYQLNHSSFYKTKIK
jgi:fluoroquinolone resistance protein